MTATLTSAAQNYNDGARIYCVDLRTSTVAAGTLWVAMAAWVFVATAAGSITKRHHGLELVHCATEDGEQFKGLVVDQDGTAEFSAVVTAAVGSTFAFTAWLDTDNGNDSNDGLSSGAPRLTLAAALDLFRGGNWSAGAEHRLFIQGTASVSSPTGGEVWNYNTQANGLGSALAGRMHFLQWAGETQAQVSITTDHGFASPADDQGLHVDGVHIVGSYTDGGSAVTADGISMNVASSGNDGWNVSLRNCQIRGFNFAVAQQTSSVAITEMANGAFDWVTLDGVVFGSCYGTHIYFDQTRYLGFANITWGILNGNGTGHSLRFQQTSYWSITECTVTRTGGSAGWRANAFRLNAGFGTSTWDRTQFGSVCNMHFQDTSEAIEIEMPTDDGDRYIADTWFWGVSWDCSTTPISAMFQFSTTSGDSWDVTRVRITNCSGRGAANPTHFLRFNSHSSATTAKLHSLMIDQCTWYQEQSQGFFTRDAVFISVGGSADNIDDDAFTIRSNYAFCADTDANSPRCFWIIPSASAKVGSSDYNVLASAGTNTTTWSDADSLATWVGATPFDDNSFEITSASHNLTSVTALSFDPKPAADGTPSATLPQVRRGEPGFGYTDADRYLRDATLPDCGSHEYGTGTLMDDASFGGGGTVPSFFGLAQLDSGFRTIAAAGLNGVLLE
jgi:hypothetical protein